MRATLMAGLLALALSACERQEGTPGGYSKDTGGTVQKYDERAAVPQPESGTVTVEMTADRAFWPNEVTVKTGDTVEWKNTSRDNHTVSTDPDKVTSSEGKTWVKIPEGATPFHSGDVRSNETFRHTFRTPGTYQYVCTLHEGHGMMGTVIVEPKE